jgi:nitrate/TMAO reductase-like tetraheme cytochrome c subunit
MNLSKNVRVVQLTTARSAAFTTKFSKALDMVGFEGCMFIVQASTLFLANTSAKVYAQGCTSTAGTFKTYQGYAHSTQGSGVNYRNIIVDCYKPTKRYIRCRVTGSSSAAGNVNSILAIQYGARYGGSTHLYDSTTLADSTAIIGSTS